MQDVILYIWVRTDLASMTPGRVAAQVSHITSIAHEHYKDDYYFTKWKKSGGVCGTVILLEAPSGLCEVKEMYPSCFTFYDGTYPLQDGAVTHLIGVETVAAYFVKKDSVEHNNIKETWNLYNG